MNPKFRRLFAAITVFSIMLAACGGTATTVVTSSPPEPTEEAAATDAPASTEAAATVAPAPTEQPTLPPQPAEPTVFRIGIGIDLNLMDPAHLVTTLVANVAKYTVESLVSIDKEGNAQPSLATEWEISDDGLEYTFHLREGVQFHDGTILDADVVKWNFDRVFDPEVKSRAVGNLRMIKEVEAVDPQTFVVRLAQPTSPMLGILGSFFLVSPGSVDVEGNAYERLSILIGTGPYAFKERTPGEQYVVTRNENYWGEQPYYDEVIFQIVPEAATRESLLLADQVDMIVLPPASDMPALQTNPDVTVLLAPASRILYIGINNTDEVLSDVRVRQALNYAVDKQAIIRNVLFDTAEPMENPIGAKLYGDCPQPAYDYNPDKARELLSAAGAENLELGFISPTGRYVQDFPAAEAIAGYLAEVGVKTSLETMDWPSYVAAVTTPPEQNTLDLHLLGWAPPFLDASQMALMYLSSFQTPNGFGTTFYGNADVDQLLVTAMQESDSGKREELYCQASEIVWEEAPVIFLWVQQFPIVYRSNITNVDYLPTEEFVAIYARPIE